MSSDRADRTAESTTNTPQRDISRSDEQTWARTERVTRSRPIAPVRRFSASDGSRQGAASLQRPVLVEGTQVRSNQGGNEEKVGSFGFPTPVIPRIGEAESNQSGDEAALDASRQTPSSLRHAERPQGPQDYNLSSTQNPTSSEIQRHQGKTVSFADEHVALKNSEAKQPDVPSDEQVEQAFALHASYQREGSTHSPAAGSDSGVMQDTPSPSSAGKGILRNKSATTTTDKDSNPQKGKSKLRLYQRPRKTLILGHKAGLWLTNYAFESFCQVANTLLLHQWNDLHTSRLPKMVGPKRLQNWEFSVDIRDSDKKDKQVVIKPYTEVGRKNYEKSIMPVLQKNEPKPLIRVRDGKLECGFECKDPSCDNCRDLEVVAPDVGFLRILVDWHRWREHPKLIDNSQVFENGVFGLLFPLPDGNQEYMIELPDGSTFHVSRDASPSFSAEVQEALSGITTSESREGVRPQTIKLIPYTPVQAITMERPPTSPSQRSPGSARAEGTIFVHRPANFTHFRYDPPHTMERFFGFARKYLYPETKGKLKLRISPSNAFRQTGKLLLPIAEQKTYLTRDEDGATREDVWRESIVEQWLTPQEDVWVIKVFDSIKVYNGLLDKDTGHRPKQWDVSAFGNRDSDDREDLRWNIPPESIMHGLAKISLNLLNIDPRSSNVGIVLRVKRRILEVLYKIDGDAVAIYPGDYEESEAEESQTVQAMKNLGQKKIIAKDAVEALYMPEVKRNPAQADGRFNNLGHLGIQLPQTTWNPEGTHLGPAPSYASNALIYSATDMGLLQQRLFRAESEVLMREEACRVCGLTFLKRSGGKDLDRTTEITDHYASHVMAGPRACSMRGCEEDLGDPDKYSTWADIVRHISGHGHRVCPTPNCHCPLWLLTHEQLTEHLEIHPETSSLRNQVPEAPSAIRRESATQTNPTDLGPNFRYEAQSEDSLAELPVGDVRLWCGICNHYLEAFTDKEKENHAKQCKISVDDLIPMEFNKSFKVANGHLIATLKSRFKPPTRRVIQREQTSTVEAATTSGTAVDPMASTTASGQGTTISTTTNEVEPSNLPAENADQTTPAQGGKGKGKKAQTNTKATQAATATQRDSTEPSITANPMTSEPSSGKSPRKRGPKAKAQTPDDPDDPANPPKPARKPRGKKKATAAKEPATTAEDPQPESSQQTRASRAKKTNNQTEGTEPPQDPPSVPADIPGSSLDAPAPEETTTAAPEQETTTEPPETTEPEAPTTTKRPRAKKPTAAKKPTTTTSKKRKTPAAPKPTAAAKKRKTAATTQQPVNEAEEPEESSSIPPAEAEATTAPTTLDPPAASDNDNDPAPPAQSTRAKTTGKGKKPVPAATRSSARQRGHAASEPAASPPPAKRRRVAGGGRAQVSASRGAGSAEGVGAGEEGGVDGDGEGAMGGTGGGTRKRRAGSKGAEEGEGEGEGEDGKRGSE